MNEEEQIAEVTTDLDERNRSFVGRKAVTEPSSAELESSRDLLIDLNKQLVNDVNVAFCKDFLEAAAVESMGAAD